MREQLATDNAAPYPGTVRSCLVSQNELARSVHWDVGSALVRPRLTRQSRGGLTVAISSTRTRRRHENDSTHGTSWPTVVSCNANGGAYAPAHSRFRAQAVELPPALLRHVAARCKEEGRAALGPSQAALPSDPENPDSDPFRTIDRCGLVISEF